MAATNVFKVSDLIKKYGWAIMPYLSNLGVNLLTEAAVLFVDSGATGKTLDADDGVHGHSFELPLATLDYAIGLCTADQGDIILVAPNHTETVTGVGGITLDVGGVSVIGLGRGTARPTFLMDGAATVTAAVSDDDISLQNLVFKAGHSDIAKLFNITTAKHFTVKDCDFLENAANENFLITFLTSTTNDAADGLTIINCKEVGADTSKTYFAHLQGDLDGLVMEDCYVNLAVNTNDLAPILCATGKDLTNCKIMRNHFSRLNNAAKDLMIDNDTTANTGIVAHNTMLHALTTGEVLIDLTGVCCVGNYASGAVDASGYLLPGADS